MNNQVAIRALLKTAKFCALQIKEYFDISESFRFKLTSVEEILIELEAYLIATEPESGPTVIDNEIPKKYDTLKEMKAVTHEDY